MQGSVLNHFSVRRKRASFSIILTIVWLINFHNSVELHGQDIDWAYHYAAKGGSSSLGITKVSNAGEVWVAGSFKDTLEYVYDNRPYKWYTKDQGDVFIAKHNKLGELIWAGHFRGTGYEMIHALEVDESGNVYILGSFDIQMNGHPHDVRNIMTAKGKRDMFILKFSASGDFIWKRQFGGSESRVLGGNLAVSKSGAIICSGNFKGSIEYSKANSKITLLSEGSQSDMFVMQINKDGDLQWFQHIKSSGGVGGGSITINNTGTIYVMGGGWGEFSLKQNAQTYLIKESRFGGHQILLMINDEGDIQDHVSLLSSTGGGILDIEANSKGEIVGVGFFGDSLSLNISGGKELWTTEKSSLINSLVLSIKPDKSVKWIKQVSSLKDVRTATLTIDQYDNIYVPFSFRDSVELVYFDQNRIFLPKGKTSTLLGVLNSSNGAWIHFEEFGGQNKVNLVMADIDPTSNELILAGSLTGDWTLDFDTPKTFKGTSRHWDGMMVKLSAIIKLEEKSKEVCTPLYTITLSDGREIELFKENVWEPALENTTIGDNVWASKNLDVTEFRDGSPIPRARTNQEWADASNNREPAWCYYGNDSTNNEKHGKLYNWYAVNNPRGLAPCGWYIPNYNDLRSLIGPETNQGWSIINKEDWNTIDSQADNASGFTALPSGVRIAPPARNGFREQGTVSMIWSNTSVNPGEALVLRLLSRGGLYSGAVVLPFKKGNGAQVRVMRSGVEN